MAWPGILASRRDVDSPWKADLFDDLHDRDDSLHERTFPMVFTEVSTTSAFSTYVVVFTETIYIPVAAHGIRVGCQLSVTTGDSNFFQWFLDDVSIAAADFINDVVHPTYNDTKRKTNTTIIDAAPAIRGTRVALELRMTNLGGGTSYAKSSFGAVCAFL